MSNVHTSRRHDIDWLRVLAFLILIFYHIGMYYVSDWGWHVKSQHQSEVLQNVMLLVNPWRMSLIFFISGFALCMVEPKISAMRLLRIRFLRVFLPLVIGMYLIVPPQVYFEAAANFAYSGGYFQFWLEYINPSTKLLPQMHVSPNGLLTWNHLWYLIYLWAYTLIYLVLRPIFRFVGDYCANNKPSALAILVLPVLILTIYGIWLKSEYPSTHALFDDWYNHAVYFSVFFFGYLAGKSAHYTNTVINHRRVLISGALLTYTVKLIISNTNWISLSAELWSISVQLLHYSNLWLWVLAVVGFAGRYLNRPSPLLSYLNDAILPWYILHQTVIIIIATSLGSLRLAGGIESALLVIATFACCAVLYELIRRNRVSRFMFGMKLAS